MARKKDSPKTPELAPDAPRSKRRQRTVWQEARRLLGQHRGRLMIGLVLIVVGRLAGMVLPYSTKFLVDDVLLGKNLEMLRWIALAIGAAALLQAVSSYTLSILLSIAAQRTIAEMRKSLQQHVIRLPVTFFDSTKTGVLISRVLNDAEGIRNLVGTGVVQMVGGLLTAALSLILLFYLNWRLTLLTLVVLLAFAAVMAFTFSRLRPLFRERSEVYARVSGRLTEMMGGARIVKSYTAERREDLIFARGVHQLLRLVARTIHGMSIASSSSALILGAIGVLMTLFGTRAVLVDGTMTEGDLIRYAAFTLMMAVPLVQISSIGTQLPEAFAGLDRIRELRSLATEDEEDLDRDFLRKIEGDIRFEEVSFEYKEGVPVLKGISFTAPPGSTTALVGSSGSGKSTLTGLVMAFYRPLTGQVLVDGKDLAGLRLRDYRQKLGIVMQDNFLFDGTVLDNIRYGRPDASREEILEAGRIAHCDAFVEGFEDGYDTVVGERGVKVSGGQRQRIAIARAILADPRILILDEATSSLDSESEAMIQDGLNSLRRGRTTFVIAHRLSTIRSADQILVLEEGEIVERGNHEELMAKNGRYRELHDRQYQLEKNRFINPGEDFTPEPEAIVAPPAPRGGRSL